MSEIKLSDVCAHYSLSRSAADWVCQQCGEAISGDDLFFVLGNWPAGEPCPYRLEER